MLYFPSPADPSGPLVTPEPQVPAPVLPNRGDLPEAHTPGSELFFVHWSVGEWVAYSALTVIVVVVTAIEVTRLARMLYAWRLASHLSDIRFASTIRPPRHSLSILVPVRHEGRLLSDTLETLVQQDHPDFEIIVIVGDDDPLTHARARQAAERHPDVMTVVVDAGSVKTRPGALNCGLRAATGDIVGVFDAGEDVRPGLLSAVDSRFSETSADVIQAGVQRMNLGASWWSLHEVLHNYFWSRSGLHQRANSHLIALGDHTSFIKRTWLEWSAGWDEKCLAEHYELGVRLSAAGAKFAVAYSPDLVTRERVAAGIGSMFAQRTRSVLGSLQVLEKGDWRALPSLRQRLLVRFQLWGPFLQSTAALLVPVAIIAAFVLNAPTAIVAITFAPLAVALIMVAVEMAGLSEFGELYGQKVRLRDYGRLIVGTLPYQLVLAAASYNAVVTAQERDYSLDRDTAERDGRRPPVSQTATARVLR